MQLSKFTDYGLRILIQLAVARPERVSVASVARVFSISDHHVAKVASALVHAGFITSERGRLGGLRLAQSPADISIGAVTRALTRNTAVVECFEPNNHNCKIQTACALRFPLAEAQEAFFAVLDRYTLADVTQNKSALAALLVE